MTPHPNHGQPPAPAPVDCPFKQATVLPKRAKVLLWSEPGDGKTWTSLQFPDPALIDLEGGADLYGNRFRFDAFRCTTADEVMAAVTWLAAHEHGYKTVIIDSMSVYFDQLQKKWSEIFLLRNRGSKGYRFEYFDMGPREWQTVKAEHKELLRRLSGLPMNVVATARAKPLYADGSFMRVAGTTYDAEKGLGYAFDSVVQLYRDEKGRYMARCTKDRTGLLPPAPFPCTYEVFEKAFGMESLTRPADIGAGVQPEPPRTIPLPPETGA